MASKSVIPNPAWSLAQNAGWDRVQEALPIALGYLGEDIPVLDNHSDKQLVDEVGVLKQAKKIVEKAEKAHVERLKFRLGSADGLKGDVYEATYRGGGRVILNQEACKEIVAAYEEEGVHLKRLLAAIKSGQVTLPENVILGYKKETIDLGDGTPPTEVQVPESNNTDFFTTAAGGRSLYVEPIV